MADTTPGPAGRRVVRGDLTVTKTPDPGDRPAPSVTLCVSSEYDVPVAVRIVEPLPDDVDPDRLCVPASATDNWSVADDGLAWSGHVPPGGESEAVYGVLPADADQARTFLGAPVVDAVHPAAPESDGGPTWRAGGAATPVRTMADVASGESPAALAAAEATMRTAMAAPAPAGTGSDLTDGTGGDATDAQVAAAAAGVAPTAEETRGTPAADPTVDRDSDLGAERDSGTAVDRDSDLGAERDSGTAVDRDSDLGADRDADPTGDSDGGTRLEVVFVTNATTRARQRALRAFARTADVTGCDPGIGRVASGRADAVTLRVAGDAGRLADALREHDAVRRVADVTGADSRPPAERTFRELQRQYDPVPPAELERELAATTADDGPMADEPVSLADLLDEHGTDREGTTTSAATDDATSRGGDAPDAAPAGRAPASDTEATDADASDPGGAGRDVPAGERGDTLEDRFGTLHERVERLEAVVDSLTDEAGAARIDRAVLESDVGRLSRDLEDLSERVVAVEGRDGTADRLSGGRRVE